MAKMKIRYDNLLKVTSGVKEPLAIKGFNPYNPADVAILHLKLWHDIAFNPSNAYQVSQLLVCPAMVSVYGLFKNCYAKAQHYTEDTISNLNP